MASPASSARRPMLLSAECTYVPRTFWDCVVVGCRMSVASTESRMPAELRSGWAEKRMSGCVKTAPQTMPRRMRTPNWAMGAVPGSVVQVSGLRQRVRMLVSARTSLQMTCHSPKKRFLYNGSAVGCWASPGRPSRGSSSRGSWVLDILDFADERCWREPERDPEDIEGIAGSATASLYTRRLLIFCGPATLAALCGAHV